MMRVFDRSTLQISDACFETLCQLFERESGILLRPDKRSLVVSRLQRRLEARGLSGFEEYCLLLHRPDEVTERRAMVDALTTHETYFFRELGHFQHLAQSALPSLKGHELRLWSAASSTGEETYSLAMVLAEVLGQEGWILHGSDLSMRVVWLASRGLYPLRRLEFMPPGFLRKYCLRGQGEYEGSFLVKRELREQTRFFCHNLLDRTANLGMFDVIFLRNVLIYFTLEKRRIILGNAISRLRPGGYLYLGNSESMEEVLAGMEPIGNSIYRRVPRARGEGS